jgi:hypothetical protein
MNSYFLRRDTTVLFPAIISGIIEPVAESASPENSFVNPRQGQIDGTNRVAR